MFVAAELVSKAHHSFSSKKHRLQAPDGESFFRSSRISDMWSGVVARVPVSFFKCETVYTSSKVCVLGECLASAEMLAKLA